MTGRRRPRADERGAVAIVVAVLMSAVLVTVAAYAVDLGLQRVARTDMQSLADVVSLDLARELDGRPAAEIAPTLPALAAESLQRNGGTVGDPPVLDAELGLLDQGDGSFTPVTGSSVPNAVRVTAGTRVDFAFGVASGGGAERAAVASANPGACLKLGSSALDLNSGSSTLLSGILGDALGVSVLSYTGLVGSQVTLGALAASLGVGTADELLATEVTVGQLYAAVAHAVSNDDDPGNDGAGNALSASVLQAIQANASLHSLRIGQILSLAPSDDAALESTVDVLDLVTASAYVANGDNALAIPGATLPAGVTASLYVVEAPRLACGRGVAETSQLRLVLEQTLPVVSALNLQVASVKLEVSLDLAKARGGVASVSCTDGVASGLQARIDQATLVHLGTRLDVKLLGLPVTSATIPAGVPATGSGGTYAVALPQYYDEVFHVPGSGTVGIPQVSAAQLSALGINLGAVGSLVVAVVNPALQALSGVITNVLTPLLGLRIAGVDVFPVRTATCLNPSLVG